MQGKLVVLILICVLAFSNGVQAQSVNFNSDKNVGHAPLLVNFYGHCKEADVIDPSDTIIWDSMYGGTAPIDRNLIGPDVWFQYIEPGMFNVFKGISGTLTSEVKRNFIQIYGPSGYAPLEFQSGSEANIKYPWENLVDGDIYCWDGITLLRKEQGAENPYGIFSFVDGKTKQVNKFRVRVDANVQANELWVSSVNIYTAPTVENPVFTKVLSANLQGSDWDEFTLAENSTAALVKIEIADARSGQFMITELEAYEDIPIPSLEYSGITVTSPHFADSEDAATIMLFLRDKDNRPISTYDKSDIKFYINYQDGSFGPLNLSKSYLGIYFTKLTANVSGVYSVMAVAHGAVIKNDIVNGKFVPAKVEFYGFAGQKGELQLIEGSPTSKSQGWDNLTDGELEGWSGTVTASGNPAYAIFQFPRGIRMPINKIYLKTDNGVADQKYEYRQYNTIRVLYSNDLQNWSTLLTVDGMVQEYKYFWVPQVFAKYIKLELAANVQRRDDWKQIVEFEVQFDSHEGFGSANEQQAVVENAKDFNLETAYPNPFNPSTTIKFELPREQHVKIQIFNTRGQLVDMLVDETMQAGMHQIIWDASAQPSGLYFYKMIAGEFSKTHRMLYLK